MNTNDADATDFKFGLGETVDVGDMRGNVVGFASFIDQQDEFLVAFPYGAGPDASLPFRMWFRQWQINEPTKH